MGVSGSPAAGEWRARGRSGRRALATEAARPDASRGARQSASFTLNLFRGHVEPAQVFPFPEPLTEDQRQTLAELVPPVEKFFEEVHSKIHILLAIVAFALHAFIKCWWVYHGICCYSWKRKWRKTIMDDQIISIYSMCTSFLGEILRLFILYHFLATMVISCKFRNLLHIMSHAIII